MASALLLAHKLLAASWVAKYESFGSNNGQNDCATLWTDWFVFVTNISLLNPFLSISRGFFLVDLAMMQRLLVLWLAVQLRVLAERCEGDAHGMIQTKRAGSATAKPTSNTTSEDIPKASRWKKTSPAVPPSSKVPEPSQPQQPQQQQPLSTVKQVNITTFQWEPHWQCAEADSACTAAAQQKFQQLANESGAQIAAALELKGAALANWSVSKEYEDAVSIMVAPGWQVLKEGGGNICCNGQRGLAVMLVKPPWPVSNCETLCVMAVHPGHYPIESGKSIVQSVCGTATDSCAIALGDWNVDAAGVSGGSFDSWQKLVGGNPPVFVVPNSETCCIPSTCCRFDHVATNIPGAKALQVKVWDYQLLDKFSMDEEHMPVSVHFSAPVQLALTS